MNPSGFCKVTCCSPKSPSRREGGRGPFGLSQDGFVLDTPDGHAGAQVQRVVHCKLARADLHDAAAEVRDVVHRRLQDSIRVAGHVGVGPAHRDARQFRHFRVHGPGQLLLIGSGREVPCLAEGSRWSTSKNKRIVRIEVATLRVIADLLKGLLRGEGITGSQTRYIAFRGPGPCSSRAGKMPARRKGGTPSPLCIRRRVCDYGTVRCPCQCRTLA